MNRQQAKWFYLIILSLIWGSSFILIKKSLIGLTPIQVGALRIIITAIFLFMAGTKTLKEIKKEHWKWIAWSGFLGSFFPPFLFAVAQTELDSAIASILNSLTPLNTTISGILLFGIIVTRRQIWGVVLGLLGTVILIAKGAEFNPDQNYWYSTLIIVSSVGYALNVNILKKYLQGLSALSIAVGNFLVILVPAIIVLISTGFFITVFSNPEMHTGLVYVVVLSLFGTAIAKVLFNKLVSVASPVFASSVTYTMPLMAIFWGVLDGESLSVYQLIGGVIILLGVYLANKKNGNNNK
ncbi:EamA family transporter [Leptobacterium flavescens]|uniref:EamA family transporter n=1 Tax=Leptobacterium flavescens TaxID=472055 RepID=A0A6P0UMQ4_9FLAO|nr:DMT family transporter [Leptobacterium flavescens]NER14534.1 EamA family transporter [Leptobacterium flavescens]